MSNFCACNGTLNNTGIPSKQRAIQSGVRLFVVQMKADDGTENGIAPDDVIDQAYLDALINHADQSKRWYPIGTFQNQEDVRGDAITETFSDGSSAITQQGIRAYTGWLINYAAKYVENLASFRCVDFGVFIADSCGAIIGSIKRDESILKPVRVNAASWNPTYVKGTPAVSAKLSLGFEFSQLERDEYLRVISETEITADVLNAEGLLEVNGTASSIITTGFDLDLKVDFDEFLDASKTVVPGWVLADFVLFNETTGLPIVITSVTEGPDGTYAFVITAQSSADVLTLTNDLAVKQGFYLEETITIP